MAPRLKKDGTPVAPRGQGGKPRAAYIVYTIEEIEDGKFDLNIVSAHRSADEVLKATSADRALSYKAFEIK